MFLKVRELYYKVKFYFISNRKSSIIIPNDYTNIRIVKKVKYRY